MLYAVRGNKQLQIDEKEKQAYLNLGYDIAEEVDGKLKQVATSPAKTVPYAQFEVLQIENEALKEQLAGGSDELKADLDKANAEIKELKGKLAAAEKQQKAADPGQDKK